MVYVKTQRSQNWLFPPHIKDLIPKDHICFSLRKTTVEPVYGHMKQNLGFREFLLRELEKVKIEMNIISIAHNLSKIHRMTKENQLNYKKENIILRLMKYFYLVNI